MSTTSRVERQHRQEARASRCASDSRCGCSRNVTSNVPIGHSSDPSDQRVAALRDFRLLEDRAAHPDHRGDCADEDQQLRERQRVPGRRRTLARSSAPSASCAVCGRDLGAAAGVPPRGLGVLHPQRLTAHSRPAWSHLAGSCRAAGRRLRERAAARGTAVGQGVRTALGGGNPWRSAAGSHWRFDPTANLCWVRCSPATIRHSCPPLRPPPRTRRQQSS